MSPLTDSLTPTSDLSSRLVPLPDGRHGLRTLLTIETHDVGPVPPPGDPSGTSNSCLDFVSSDESLDRYAEIISVTGWKLDNYFRNPVFQNATIR